MIEFEPFSLEMLKNKFGLKISMDRKEKSLTFELKNGNLVSCASNDCSIHFISFENFYTIIQKTEKKLGYKLFSQS